VEKFGTNTATQVDASIKPCPQSRDGWSKCWKSKRFESNRHSSDDEAPDCNNNNNNGGCPTDRWSTLVEARAVLPRNTIVKRRHKSLGGVGYEGQCGIAIALATCKATVAPYRSVRDFRETLAVNVSVTATSNTMDATVIQTVLEGCLMVSKEPKPEQRE
jgi:hypothetical protein